jgi:uncharacterized phage protein (TIGR01671 family)
MNRLKFRIWDKQNKKWLENSSSLHCYSNWTICPFTGNLGGYIGLIDGDNNDTVYASPADDYYLEGTKLVKEPRYVIQQYTGLKDKNEKEIYEGDIVKALPATRYGMGIDQGQHDYMLLRTPKIVLYKDCSFKLFDKNDITSMNYCIDNNVEIIGNFFENPELLNS